MTTNIALFLYVQLSVCLERLDFYLNDFPDIFIGDIRICGDIPLR